MSNIRKPELLMPAGNLETLKTAVLYGADAVYIGGEAFSLRAKADNFGKDVMKEAIRFAHEGNCKVYVTVNIFAHNRDLKEAAAYLEELRDIGPDALIMSDPGLMMQAKAICPQIPIHVSTQMNNTNYGIFNFWYGLGAARVVCARELTLEEIRELKAHIPADKEIEAFVHGAMCISYSGRCLLSSFMAGRDANLGACTHPCRWQYSLMEESRPGEYYPVTENERGTFIFNSKDMCMIEHIPELCEAGIDSFKVEGRMKTQLYVATVARCYRRAIDDYFEDPGKYRRNIPLYRKEVEKCTYREYSTGFYFGRPGAEGQIYDASTYVKDYVYYGCADSVDPDGRVHLMQKNKFSVGDTFEILKPDMTDVPVTVLSIRDEQTGEEMPSCPHASQRISVLFADGTDREKPAAVCQGDILGGRA